MIRPTIPTAISPSTRTISTAGRGALAILVALSVLVAVLPASVARAATDDEEPHGDLGDAPSAKSDKPHSLQAIDPDAPVDPAVVAARKKAAADAALLKQQQQDAPPPVYTKWQFWALTGAVVVAVVGIIVGGHF